MTVTYRCITKVGEAENSLRDELLFPVLVDKWFAAWKILQCFLDVS